MTNNLKKLLQAITQKHIYIQMHNYPDPDAIASAYGLQQLLGHFDIQTTICYWGQIERYNIKYIVDKLNLYFVNLTDLQDTIREDDEIILVDSQRFNSNIVDIKGKVIATIDHHPQFTEVSYRFSDIRPEVGSCAAIIASYYFENDIPMSREMATVLTFGIRCDTAKLSRGVSQLDLDMLTKMFSIAANKVIYYLENTELQADDLYAYSQAIESVQFHDGGIAFAYVGQNCHEALVALVADFLLTIKQVTFVVVYSQREKDIKFSVRCNRGLNSGSITARALACFGSGGGHQVMAGGLVPFVGNDKEREVLIDIITKEFIKQINLEIHSKQNTKKKL